jgi:hypothetical protein
MSGAKHRPRRRPYRPSSGQMSPPPSPPPSLTSQCLYAPSSEASICPCSEVISFCFRANSGSLSGREERGKGDQKGREGGREGGRERQTLRKSVLVPTRMKGTPGAWCFISGYLGRERRREGGREEGE